MHRAGMMALLTLGLLGCGDAARDQAAEAVKKIGGHVEYDDSDPGVVRGSPSTTNPRSAARTWKC